MGRRELTILGGGAGLVRLRVGSSDIVGGYDLFGLECVYLCLFCVWELVYRCIYVHTATERHIGD